MDIFFYLCSLILQLCQNEKFLGLNQLESRLHCMIEPISWWGLWSISASSFSANSMQFDVFWITCHCCFLPFIIWFNSYPNPQFYAKDIGSYYAPLLVMKWLPALLCMNDNGQAQILFSFKSKLQCYMVLSLVCLNGETERHVVGWTGWKAPSKRLLEFIRRWDFPCQLMLLLNQKWKQCILRRKICRWTNKGDFMRSYDLKKNPVSIKTQK